MDGVPLCCPLSCGPFLGRGRNALPKDQPTQESLLRLTARRVHASYPTQPNSFTLPPHP